MPLGARPLAQDAALSRSPASRGIDLDGNEIELAGDGLMAQALQHEIDHLDGMLYLDRLEKTSVASR